ncbi:MAG: chemotaxis protein CheC [Enterocloster bolteae]
MNEINVSAICEVMNQMMGSSATALSEFLGNPVNISTPVSFPIESENGFKEKYFTSGVKDGGGPFSLER